MKRKVKWGVGLLAVLLPVIISLMYFPLPLGRGILLGALISSFINLIEFLIIRIVIVRSMKKFLGTLVGGIAFRMLVVLGTAVYLQNYATVSLLWYLVSFIFYFIVYQGLEIYYFHKHSIRLQTT